jgi:hypothetical protein
MVTQQHVSRWKYCFLHWLHNTTIASSGLLVFYCQRWERPG